MKIKGVVSSTLFHYLFSSLASSVGLWFVDQYWRSYDQGDNSMSCSIIKIELQALQGREKAFGQQFVAQGSNEAPKGWISKYIQWGIVLTPTSAQAHVTSHHEYPSALAHCNINFHFHDWIRLEYLPTSPTIGRGETEEGDLCHDLYLCHDQ